jgi:hypothetical protein
MIRCKLCVLAENVVQDSQTNNISVFGIFEEIVPQGFPFFLTKIAFFALWERDSTDSETYVAEFSVTLNDQRLHTASININFTGARRHRSIVNIQGFVIPQPGQLVFTLRIQDGPEATCTLPVTAPPSVIGSTGSSGSG